MFRLAHISDVHLGPLPHVTPLELASKRMTGYINWQRNRAKKLDPAILENLVAHMRDAAPDHISVTGDLVNLALEKEFTGARQWLDRLGGGEEVSVVLGNHDCYVHGAMEIACREFQPFMRTDEGADTTIAFPYLRKRQGIALIGVNSGHVSAPFYATGNFDGPQAERLADLLKKAGNEGLFRVVMIHHPPFKNATARHKRLIGASLFRSVIASAGAELVLHGHTHIESLQWIDGLKKRVPVVGVPSASHAPPPVGAHGKRPGGRYNLFSISGSTSSWNCHMAEYGYSDGSREVELLGERDLF